CDRAIALRPDFVEAHDNRGVALSEAGRHAEALASFDRALAVAPDYAVSHRNRGGALEALKRPEEALESYAKALAYDPGLPFVAGNALLLSAQLCDWRERDGKTAALLRQVDAGLPVSPPFPMLSIPSSPAQQKAAASSYFSHKMPAAASPVLA